MNNIPTFEDFVNESNVSEGINVKDIKVGTILNFKDGETWKVTKTPGISTGKIFAAPYGDTRKSYISIAIEYQIDKLKQDVKSISESQEFIGESKISEIFLMANYAKSFTAFRKEFMDEYGKPKSAKELQQIEAWLQTIWNNREVQKNENYTVDFELDEAAEVSVDVALSPANKKKLKNAFETEFLGIDKLTFKKDGTIVAKKGYFYRHGDSPEKTANNLKTKLSHLGIEIEIKDAYDDFKPWPKDSNFVIEFKIIN